MRVVKNVLIGMSLIFSTALIGFGCMTDRPEVSPTDDQEITTEALTSSPDEAVTSVSDANDVEVGADLSEMDGVETESVGDFAICMAVELGVRITQNCVDVCVACVTGSIFTKPINCPLCGVCAGVNGVQVAKHCKQFL